MTMRLGLAATALAVLASAAVIGQQSTPSTTLPSGAPGQIAQPSSPGSSSQVTSDSTATIRGRVLRADNSRPLEGVRVRTTSGALALTDADGRYELKKVGPGNLEISASRSGFIEMYYGQRRPRDPRRGTELTAGQVMERVDFALPRGAVIAGSVVDDTGAPVELASVSLLRERFVNGERRLVDAPSEFGSRDLTDDLGQFRLYGIAPGTYYLAASPAGFFDEGSRSSIPVDATRMTLFPGTRARDSARTMTVAEGEQIDGLTVRLLPTRLAAIRGTVGTPASAPGSGRIILVKQAEVGLETTELWSYGPNGSFPNGSFVVPSLPPGRYVLVARADGYFGIERVTLDGEDRVVSIAMKAARALSGRVTFDGGTSSGLTPGDVTLRAQSTIVNSPGMLRPRGVVARDWTFKIEGLEGPSKLFIEVPTGWGIKQVVRRGADMTDAVIDLSNDLSDVEVVLTRQLTTIVGVVRDPSGQPTNAAALVVFADDPAKWPVRDLDPRRSGGRYIRRVTARDGRVSVSGLPEGSYVAVAIEALDAGDELDPGLLERLQSIGTRFTLNEGETRALDLKVTALP